ncbi:MAG: hypothetical protein M1604_00010 [Patescibacteria group bacterium]|nr:hypothetical protein [Patescibacteria group bacterium]
MDTEVSSEKQTALKLAMDIGLEQFTRIQKDIKPDFEKVSVEEQKKSAKAEAIFLYIKNFWTHYEFLSEKLGTEKDEDFHFFIPILRTLLEMYGELLYFLSQDGRTQIGTFVGYYLLNKSDYYRFLATKSAEIRGEYDRFLRAMKSVLDDEKISFPEDINKFTKELMRSSGFGFPHFDVILQPKYLAGVSDKTFSCWEKDSPSNFYDKYYRTYSDYTHRGFTNQAMGYTGTEKFWITQFLYIIAQLTIELCDKKVFDSAYEARFEELCQKIKRDYEEMLKEWDAKRPRESHSADKLK